MTQGNSLHQDSKTQGKAFHQISEITMRIYITRLTIYKDTVWIKHRSTSFTSHKIKIHLPDSNSHFPHLVIQLPPIIIKWILIILRCQHNKCRWVKELWTGRLMEMGGILWDTGGEDILARIGSVRG